MWVLESGKKFAPTQAGGVWTLERCVRGEEPKADIFELNANATLLASVGATCSTAHTAQEWAVKDSRNLGSELQVGRGVRDVRWWVCGVC